MWHCKFSASRLVLLVPSVDEALTLVLPLAHVDDEVFHLQLQLLLLEPLVLSETSIVAPSLRAADVANRFVAAVLKPWPLIRQHLAYQAPANRRKEIENPVQELYAIYVLIKMSERVDEGNSRRSLTATREMKIYVIKREERNLLCESQIICLCSDSFEIIEISLFSRFAVSTFTHLTPSIYRIKNVFLFD